MAPKNRGHSVGEIQFIIAKKAIQIIHFSKELAKFFDKTKLEKRGFIGCGLKENGLLDVGLA